MGVHSIHPTVSIAAFPAACHPNDAATRTTLPPERRSHPNGSDLRRQALGDHRQLLAIEQPDSVALELDD